MSSTAPTANRVPTWLMVLVILVMMWAASVLVSRPRGFDDLDAPGPGSMVPYDWSLEGLDSTPQSFAAYKGKPLFVNVWATWCGPCVAEMPSIARLAASPKLKGKVEFLCISVDDSNDVVRSFLRGKDWPMTILRANSLPPALLTEGIPATFLIAPDGKIVYSYLGGADWDAPEIVEKLLSMGRPPGD